MSEPVVSREEDRSLPDGVGDPPRVPHPTSHRRQCCGDRSGSRCPCACGRTRGARRLSCGASSHPEPERVRTMDGARPTWFLLVPAVKFTAMKLNSQRGQTERRPTTRATGSGSMPAVDPELEDIAADDQPERPRHTAGDARCVARGPPGWSAKRQMGFRSTHSRHARLMEGSREASLPRRVRGFRALDRPRAPAGLLRSDAGDAPGLPLAPARGPAPNWADRAASKILCFASDPLRGRPRRSCSPPSKLRPADRDQSRPTPPCASSE